MLRLTLALALGAAAPLLAQSAKGLFADSSDIGKTRAGSTVYDKAAGTWHVTGGGADMWGGEDAFRLSWVRLSGDASLAADIRFPAGSPAPLAKAVLIFRQSLDPGSAYADIAIHADGHITLQYRAAAGGKTQDVTAAERGSTRLRIERKGNRFTASIGPADGQLNAFSTQEIAVQDPVYVGIGVCAHDAEGLVAADFSNVKIERSKK